MEGLKEIRKRKGLTLRQVADQLSVSVNTVWRWENGTMEPSLDKLRRISSLYDVSTDELLQNPTLSPRLASPESCGDSSEA